MKKSSSKLDKGGCRIPSPNNDCGLWGYDDNRPPLTQNERGRPRRTWRKKRVQEDLLVLRMSWEQVQGLDADRSEWLDIAALCPTARTGGTKV